MRRGKGEGEGCMHSSRGGGVGGEGEPALRPHGRLHREEPVGLGVVRRVADHVHVLQPERVERAVVHTRAETGESEIDGPEG